MAAVDVGPSDAMPRIVFTPSGLDGEVAAGASVLDAARLLGVDLGTKTIGLALLHAGLLAPRLLPVLHWMGKLAMADVFLIALYIVAFKGIGLGRIEVAWGLWFFTACILASLAISTLTERAKVS